MSNDKQPAETLRNPAEFPADSAHVLIPGPCGQLEALIEHPEEEPQEITAVICSPAGGIGTMHNKVVHLIERSLRELGAATVRFNFRGVGASDGEFDHGVGETDDLLAIAGWIATMRPGTSLWLAGYGPGSFVAIRACQRLPVSQLVTVAPPVEHFDFDALPAPACPWLIVQGDSDDRNSPEAVYAWVEGLDAKPQLLRMEDADHGFHRRLMDLRGAIKNGIRRSLKNADKQQ